MERSAQRVVQLLADLGCPDIRVVRANGGAPAVIGRFPAPQGMPTVCASPAQGEEDVAAPARAAVGRRSLDDLPADPRRPHAVPRHGDQARPGAPRAPRQSRQARSTSGSCRGGARTRPPASSTRCARTSPERGTGPPGHGVLPRRPDAPGSAGAFSPTTADGGTGERGGPNGHGGDRNLPRTSAGPVGTATGYGVRPSSTTPRFGTPRPIQAPPPTRPPGRY